MLKPDQELDQLEEALRKLKQKYDMFFRNLRKLPPSEDRHRLEAMVHEISKTSIRDNSRRFRLNTILSRFNQYRELWSRQMREREEGPMDFRRRNAAMTLPPEPEPEPEVRPQPRAAVTNTEADPYVKVARGGNGNEMSALCDQINDANRAIGKASVLTLDQVTSMVQKQADALRERYQVGTIAFRVETVDGKVKLKAKPVQD